MERGLRRHSRIDSGATARPGRHHESPRSGPSRDPDNLSVLRSPSVGGGVPSRSSPFREPESLRPQHADRDVLRDVPERGGDPTQRRAFVTCAVESPAIPGRPGGRNGPVAEYIGQEAGARCWRLCFRRPSTRRAARGRRGVCFWRDARRDLLSGVLSFVVGLGRFQLPSSRF
jgi:hypothetical protein